MTKNSRHAKLFEQEGLLSLWFEPVYEAQYKVGEWVHVSAPKPFIGQLRERNVSHGNGHWFFSNTSISVMQSYSEEIFRPATKEEIEKASTKTISVGGQFDVTVKGNKIFHKNDDITDFVERLVTWGKSITITKPFGSYNATISDVQFSVTGCQSTLTRYSDWLKVFEHIK